MTPESHRSESEATLLANPNLSPGRVFVYASGQSCCASWSATSSNDRGTVELNMVGGPEDWWVARALVQGSESVRGRGIGSTLLRLALEKAVSMGACIVKVVPGGYNMRPKDQQRFYEKNGFKKTKTPEGAIWIWTKD